MVLSYCKGKLREVRHLMTGEGGECDSTDMHINPDRRFLYTLHRLKKGSTAIFAINPRKDTLTKVGYQFAGIHPHNLTITPNGRYLLVTCYDNNKTRAFQRNETTGELTEASQEIEVDKPICILFARSN